ncbi:hypothetical protein A6R68_20104 [Neotoma lepida]|uniref:Uncharacterized protein n=1 Tax=Neotoma lepida TaxID=56216 RepID=A0A1A6HGX0_NEOLE|nr:hypothetical protein A6R68_20104 [Neotoma lepida]
MYYCDNTIFHCDITMLHFDIPIEIMRHQKAPLWHHNTQYEVTTDYYDTLLHYDITVLYYDITILQYYIINDDCDITVLHNVVTILTEVMMNNYDIIMSHLKSQTQMREWTIMTSHCSIFDITFLYDDIKILDYATQHTIVTSQGTIMTSQYP